MSHFDLIRAKPIDHEFEVLCPHCDEMLYFFGSRGAAYPYGYSYKGGVYNLNLRGIVGNGRLSYGCQVEVTEGDCWHCSGGFFSIWASFLDFAPSREVDALYFREKGDRGLAANFIVSTVAEEWIATRFDTPQGPMLAHHFGPYRDIYREQPEPRTCWDMATDFLVERWGDLRRMPKALGLEPNDPRVRSRKMTAAERRAWKTAPDPEVNLDLDLDRIDDDIPF